MFSFKSNKKDKVVVRTLDDQRQLSKEEERRNHLLALFDISENFDKDEAIVIASVLARKYPDVIYDILRDRHQEVLDTVKTMAVMKEVI